jgi:glucose-1-phosphate adenylyltransferase
MDLLGNDPLIKFSEWNIRTNMEHRNIRDSQPLRIGRGAGVSDSLIYNGCTVEGEVERSILFPGTHVKKGARVKDSVLFFNNKVGHGALLDRVVSDVNNTFDRGVRIGETDATVSGKISVIGWNNLIKPDTVIGSGCTVYPALPSENIPGRVEPGGVVK